MFSGFSTYSQEEEAKKNRAVALSHYLEGGVYDWDEGMRALCKRAKRHHPIVAGLYPGPGELPTPLNIADDPPKQFSGNILWFCSNGDIKIFSDAETLIVCCSRDNYLRKINNYDYFSPLFRMPELIRREDANHILVEQFIDFENKAAQDDEFILKTIYEDYRNYFIHTVRHSTANCRSLNDLLSASSNAIHMEQFEDIIKAIDPELLEAKFPFMRLHGDLWTDNILLASKELWYIDWDESGEYIFFYDFFKFMWNELDVHHNPLYYEQYLKGEFDGRLKELFSIFQLEFQPERRQSYFYMFFLNFILDDTGTMKYEPKRYELADFQRKIMSPMEKG